jgi:hypothetical protein
MEITVHYWRWPLYGVQSARWYFRSSLVRVWGAPFTLYLLLWIELPCPLHPLPSKINEKKLPENSPTLTFSPSLYAKHLLIYPYVSLHSIAWLQMQLLSFDFLLFRPSTCTFKSALIRSFRVYLIPKCIYVIWWNEKMHFKREYWASILC